MIYGGGDFCGALLKLALKLADEQGGFFLVALLKDHADTDEDSPGHSGHDRSDHE
jgi:hypothetical protein